MRAASLFLAVLLPFIGACERAPARASGALPTDVYVWQRAHGAAVTDAITAHAAAFQTAVVLAAEVSWEKSVAGRAPTPRTVRVVPAWSALRTVPRIGLALRVNAYSGAFVRDDVTAKYLTALARELIADATAHGIAVTEFQIDFDAATSKLAGYRTWLEALRPAIAPVPLAFTALPSWLDAREFPALARSTDRYVLQVHSLARPSSVDAPFTLCDPAAAQSAIAHAARIGVPFRVALPTYGYALAFDRLGHFAGLSAEGPRAEWGDGFTIREIHADPVALATLVRALTADHPAALTGLIWYRLPTADDRLNWSWPTLAAVREGREPAAHLRTETRTTADGLSEFVLVNDGDGDFSGPAHLTVRWHEARRLGADALGAFTIAREDAASLHFSVPTCHVAAGTRQPVGWLRLTSAKISPDVSLEN